MTSRTLFVTAAILLAVTGVARAGTTVTYAPTTTYVPTTTTRPTLSKSDEDFLSEMPVAKFPGKAEMQDKDHDGIVDSEETGKNLSGSIADPFNGSEPDAKPKVTYTYHPTSSTMLRRSIQDDRIEDGYVQGYMQQTGPAE